MSTSSIDLNELQNNGNNVGVCDGEQRLNFSRYFFCAIDVSQLKDFDLTVYTFGSTQWENTVPDWECDST